MAATIDPGIFMRTFGREFMKVGTPNVPFVGILHRDVNVEDTGQIREHIIEVPSDVVIEQKDLIDLGFERFEVVRVFSYADVAWKRFQVRDVRK